MTRDQLFVLLMHSISKEFENHAILKGGMVLRLLGCQRQTIDLDYDFYLYRSKRLIKEPLLALCRAIPDASVSHSTNSRMLKIEVTVGDTSVIIEASLSTTGEVMALSTEALCDSASSTLPRVIAVMPFEQALAHKLAAWNERRILRDLYDIWFLYARLNVVPSSPVLELRLAKIESRLPQLKAIRRMSVVMLASAISDTLNELDQARVDAELTGLLSSTDRAGLHYKMRAGLVGLVELLSKPKA